MGILVCRLAILGPATEQGPALQALLGAALLFLAIATLVILASRSLEMSGMPLTQLGHLLWPVITQTRFGALWLVRASALLAMGIMWGFLRPSPRTDRAMLGLIAVIALVRAATGHAGDQGPSWTLLVNAIHLLAISVWAGSLLILSIAVFPRLGRSADLSPIAASFERLSRVSGWALMAILASGVFLANRALGSWSALWHTDYGRILSAKLFVFAAMAAIGAHNRYVKRPRLWQALGTAECHWRRRWREAYRAVAVEAVLGLVVLLLAATLLHGMPPRTMSPMPDASRSMAARRDGSHLDLAPYTLSFLEQVNAYGSS